MKSIFMITKNQIDDVRLKLRNIKYIIGNIETSTVIIINDKSEYIEFKCIAKEFVIELVDGGIDFLTENQIRKKNTLQYMKEYGDEYIKFSRNNSFILVKSIDDIPRHIKSNLINMDKIVKKKKYNKKYNEVKNNVNVIQNKNKTIVIASCDIFSL